jgi:ppGpp synthetase/RelA/SpoT-type nucleotidyltranferase
MDFEQYRAEGRSLYIEFVETVRTILTTAVAEAGMTAYAITGRAKHPDSLKKKLEDRKIPLTDPIDEHLRDLAGCRIVFLMNSQVERFRNSGAVRENFDVLDVNEHHAVPGTTSEDRLFDSTNYTVQLREDRLKLPEYRRFAGLKAEIQLQTLLNHAWAEMGHDTIYKRPDLRHVDKELLDGIEQRLNAVMRDHLLPAGHDFDKIARDFERLMTADRGAEEAIGVIGSSDSSDDLLGAIETVDSMVLPVASERRATVVKLIPNLVAAVERVRGKAAGDVSSEFGSFFGKTGEAVARRVAKLLEHNKFADVDLTFRTLVQLDRGAVDESEHKIWREVGENLASHDLEAWKAQGPIVQQMILDGISKLEPAELQASHSLLAAMLAKVLSTEISGYSQGDFNTIHIHSGTVLASDQLRKVRSAAIDVLIALLDSVPEVASRNEIIEALRAATRLPMHGGSEELRTVVMEDTARIMAAERERAPGWGLETRRKVETAARQAYRNFRAVPDSMKENEPLVAAQKAVATEILALRDVLNEDHEYTIYKLLMGRDPVRPDEWEDTSFNWRASAEWRSARLAETVDGISADKMPGWISRLRGFIAESSSRGDRFPLSEFAAVLAESKPAAAIALIEAMDDDFAFFLPSLLLGFDRSSTPEIARGHVDAWIGDGRYLREIADWLGRRAELDTDLLATVSAKARDAGDRPALLEAVSAAARQYQTSPERRLIEEIFLPSLDYLTKTKDPTWIDEQWVLSDGSLAAALNEGEAWCLLLSFVEVGQITTEAEMVLTTVGRHFPGLILDFFGIRLALKGDGSRIDAIPFELHYLPEPLAKEPDLVIGAAREWYGRDALFHEYRGGRLIHRIFPGLPNEASARLRDFVERGQPIDRRFVLDTLIAFDGAPVVYPLAMDVVAQVNEADELLGRVSDVLGQRGVLSGEFGQVDADRAEFDRLAEWLEDPRAKVRSYAAAERKRLEQSMAWEQRRAELDTEQRKRDWGKPDDSTQGAA